MPQMAPLSWSILMLAFLSLYTLNLIKMYFTSVFNMSSTVTVKSLKTKNFNWKW